ncbi:hypothetical protein GCM10009748_29790 [Agromyces lapidis]|uniref:Uncharacterized protein n=1 Tax=Agromyces lapidis TaxID=279574 RepID=A0ABV5SNF1_9MICO
MNVVATVIAMAFFVFGMWVMSIAPEVAGFEAATFFSGIIAVALALAIPFHVLGRADD